MRCWTFENTEDLELTYYLADRLGKTVAELEESMSAAEFVRWAIFHARKAQRAELAQKMQAAQGRR